MAGSSRDSCGPRNNLTHTSHQVSKGRYRYIAQPKDLVRKHSWDCREKKISTSSNKPGLKQLPARVSILAVTPLDKLLLVFVPAAIPPGHEHDLRVKHLPDALGDKHGLPAGKYWVGTGSQLVPLLPTVSHCHDVARAVPLCGQA